MKLKLALTSLIGIIAFHISHAQDTTACLPKTMVLDKKLNTQVAENIRYNNDELFNRPMSRDNQYTGHHSISKDFVYTNVAIGGTSARGRDIYIAVRSTKKNACAVYRFMVIEEMQKDGTYGYPKIAGRTDQITHGFSDNVKKPDSGDWKQCDCYEKTTNWLKEKAE